MKMTNRSEMAKWATQGRVPLSNVYSVLKDDFLSHLQTSDKHKQCSNKIISKVKCASPLEWVPIWGLFVLICFQYPELIYLFSFPISARIIWLPDSFSFLMSLQFWSR
uniref:Uncharacterized protein n=1 Tax=Opuntia streptacantha TaxID=393608 RepID=A0A7C9EDL7_OPUST